MPGAATITWAICAAGVLYIVAGYPLLLSALARFMPRPIAKRPFRPTVSVILPVYNGERYLEAKLRTLIALDYPKELLEILVVSDGSTDRTDQIVKGFAAHGIRLIRVEHGGKPAALNAAIAEATNELLFLTDVRQTLAPDCLTRLADCFADRSVGAASGELVIREGATPAESDIGLYWKYEKWIRARLSSIDSIFGATGACYMMRRELARPLPANCLLDDMHLPLNAFFEGYRLVMEPLAKAYDEPTSLDTEFRRKVRTLAGNYQIMGAFPGLLGLRNRMWIHFVSYKFGRLVLPWLLIALFVSSFFLPDPWRLAVLTAQCAVYLLALVDPAIPARFPLKRLSSPARSFTVMMLAVLCALSILFINPRRLWLTN